MPRASFPASRQYSQRKAEATLRRTCDAYAEAKLQTWQRYSCEAFLGESLAGQQHFAEAEPLLLEGYRGMRQREETIPAESRHSLEHTAEWVTGLYTDEGKPELAQEWEKALTAEATPSRAKP